MIKFINFPIKDVHVPDRKEDFIQLVNRLNEYLNDSKKIVIHCRMGIGIGIGRSSILASGILIKRGIKREDVFEIISKHRELEVPDTEEQEKWIFDLAAKLTPD